MVHPSLDSFSLIDASSTAGDDFLMLETPKSSNEQSDAPAEHKTADFNWVRWAWTLRRTWMPSCRNSVARLGMGAPATLEAASGTQTSPIPAVAPGTDSVCTASRRHQGRRQSGISQTLSRATSAPMRHRTGIAGRRIKKWWDQCFPAFNQKGSSPLGPLSKTRHRSSF